MSGLVEMTDVQWKPRDFPSNVAISASSEYPDHLLELPIILTRDRSDVNACFLLAGRRWDQLSTCGQGPPSGAITCQASKRTSKCTSILATFNGAEAVTTLLVTEEKCWQMLCTTRAVLESGCSGGRKSLVGKSCPVLGAKAWSLGAGVRLRNNGRNQAAKCGQSVAVTLTPAARRVPEE
jgi:hypothetical protein